MKKFFNTTGPCNASDHYMIDPLARVADFDTLIEQKSYFVIHAPRQSGKTTLLEVLAKKLTLEGKYCALRVSCEIGQPFGDDFGECVDHRCDSEDQGHDEERFAAEVEGVNDPLRPPGLRRNRPASSRTNRQR